MNDECSDPATAQSEAVRFLDRDFNQCFSQMRHYDGQIWEICKFTFTAYTALLGVAIGLYQFSIERSLDLVPAAIAALIVGLLIGIFDFALTIRNRVYFVLVTRYVNEHRGFFLSRKPLGFENSSRMYTSPHLPQYFNWRSSQLCLSWIIAALNAFLCAVTVYFALRSSSRREAATVFAFGLLLLGQVSVAVVYLNLREGKAASRAAFGVDE